MAFNPNQPREPSGSDAGGQWASAAFMAKASQHKPSEADLDPEHPDNWDDEEPPEARDEDAEFEEMDRIFHDSVDPDTMTPDVEKAVGQYTAIGGEDLNRHLRGTLDPKLSRMNASNFNTMAKSIDKMFDGVALSEETTAFRNISQNMMDSGLFKDGAVFTDPGYASTSFSEFKAGEHRAGGTVAQVLLPQGSKALPIARLSEHPGEMEILVARNSRFQVGRNGNVVTLTLLSTAPPPDANQLEMKF